MKKIIVTKEMIKNLYNGRFLKLCDLQYGEGKHYYEATRRELDDVVVVKGHNEKNNLIADAVTIAIIVFLPGESAKLLLTYEYRYPVGEFLLSPVAGLIDPEDKETCDILKTAAVREINEESGLKFNEKTDTIRVINPCAFSSPGMTDESNAFVCAELHLDNLDEINHNGAVGSELFDGFEVLDVEAARKIYNDGRDKHGFFYSLQTWAVLGYFINNYAE